MKKIIIFIALFMIAGCFSAETNYYMLRAKNKKLEESFACNIKKNLIIEVGEIEVSDYLKKSEIITKEDKNKIKISDTNLWISSLNEQVTEVLTQSINKILNQNKDNIFVCKYPCEIDKKVNKISIKSYIDSYEYNKNTGKVLLSMNAVIYFNDEYKAKKEFIIEKDSSSDEYGDIVDAMSDALSDVAKKLSLSICKTVIKK